MLEIVKLGGFAKRKPHQLSGGQRQRVALARSLVKRPKLLLLDEPLGALDNKLREHTQFELISLQDQLGVTFVVVTHDQEEAMTLASRIGVMDHGEIVQVGTPSRDLRVPGLEVRRRLHRFGQPVRGQAHRGRAANTCASASEELAAPIYVIHGISAAPGCAPSGWRCGPRRFSCRRHRPAGTDNVVRGAIQDIAYLGDLSIYLVKLATGQGGARHASRTPRAMPRRSPGTSRCT